MYKKTYKETATTGYNKSIHNKMAQDYIRYVCEQARKRQLKAAEICLAKLPNGKYLTKEDVENYAKENKYTIEGTLSIAGTERCVKIHLSKIETN